MGALLGLAIWGLYSLNSSRATAGKLGAPILDSLALGLLVAAPVGALGLSVPSSSVNRNWSTPLRR